MIQATTPTELLEALAALDVSVPPRTKGRTKAHTERYAVAHLLSTLAEAGEINYPMSLERRERPDFLLAMGPSKIGVEHTEAIASNEAYKDAIRQEGHGANMYWLSHEKPGEPKKTRKELIEEIEADFPGPGWVGDTAEREWAAGMLHFALGKLGKLQKEGFERFDRDWLLIYDNFSLPSIDRESASSLLLDLLNEAGALSEYERVFVASDSHICQLTAQEARVLSVNDVWSETPNAGDTVSNSEQPSISGTIDALKHLSETHRSLHQQRRAMEQRVLLTALTFYVLSALGVLKGDIATALTGSVKLSLWVSFAIIAVISAFYLRRIHTANRVNLDIAEAAENQLVRAIGNETLQDLGGDLSGKRPPRLVVWWWQVAMIAAAAIASALLIGLA